MHVRITRKRGKLAKGVNPRRTTRAKAIVMIAARKATVPVATTRDELIARGLLVPRGES